MKRQAQTNIQLVKLIVAGSGTSDKSVNERASLKLVTLAEETLNAADDARDTSVADSAGRATKEPTADGRADLAGLETLEVVNKRGGESSLVVIGEAASAKVEGSSITVR